LWQQAKEHERTTEARPGGNEREAG
jgi:hypothetical protein